jgi:hypothetical protein
MWARFSQQSVQLISWGVGCDSFGNDGHFCQLVGQIPDYADPVKVNLAKRARSPVVGSDPRAGHRFSTDYGKQEVRSYRFEDRYTRISSVLDFLTRRRLRRQLRSSGGATALGLDKNKLRRNSFTVAATRMKQEALKFAIRGIQRGVANVRSPDQRPHE